MELKGTAWRAGDHHGTLVGPRGLELVPGVSRGHWEHTLEAPRGFTRLVASLNPEPWPVGAGVRLSVATRSARGWTDWSPLGIYGSGKGFPRSEPTPGVAVDLLSCDSAAEAVKLRLEVEAGELGETPRIRRLVLTTWEPRSSAVEPTEAQSGSGAWGTVLEVPARSQRVEAPELADRVCSPTCLAMVLEFWGHAKPTAEVAQAVYDHAAELYGNWSFNAAYAAEHGLGATVARLEGLAQLEAEIAAGRPVVISHRYGGGELSGSPLPSTKGHLIVVVGFDAKGDVVVNDPAGEPGDVRQVYARGELRRSWLHNGDGIAYVITSS